MPPTCPTGRVENPGDGILRGLSSPKAELIGLRPPVWSICWFNLCSNTRSSSLAAVSSMHSRRKLDGLVSGWSAPLCRRTSLDRFHLSGKTVSEIHLLYKPRSVPGDLFARIDGASFGTPSGPVALPLGRRTAAALSSSRFSGGHSGSAVCASGPESPSG